MSYTKVCTLEELPLNLPVPFTVDEESVIVIRTDERSVYAYLNCCSHQDLPLNDGKVESGALVCPWHGAHFAVATGDAIAFPATAPLERCSVRLSEQNVEIEIPE